MDSVQIHGLSLLFMLSHIQNAPHCQQKMRSGEGMEVGMDDMVNMSIGDGQQISQFWQRFHAKLKMRG